MIQSPEIKIALLEDSEFYNSVFARTIQNFTTNLGVYLGCRFKINAFLHEKDFFNNIDPETGIIVLDYYLKRKNGEDIIRELESRQIKSKIILISQSRDVVLRLSKRIKNKIACFIHKDKYAIQRVCLYIEDYYTKKLLPDN